MGTIDGLNKLTMLINDLGGLLLFFPVFLLNNTKKINKFPFFKFKPKLIFYSLLPILVFIVLYSGWEYIVQTKFHVNYYLRALIELHGHVGDNFNATSFNEGMARGNILRALYYYAGSTIVLIKRITESADLNSMLLGPILFGLLFITFRKPRFSFVKLISMLIFFIISFAMIILFKYNYFGIHNIAAYVYAWPDQVYVNVFLFEAIVFLFILNFRYKALRLSLPIITYFVMLIILTKNAPWPRLLAHVILWSIILFSFLIDWILKEDKKNFILKRVWVGSIFLILFIIFYISPKALTMMIGLYEGLHAGQAEVTYLKWVNSSLPINAVILGGDKSDLVTVAENVRRPIIYNTSWTSAILVKPREIIGVKATDFAILDQLKITEVPGFSPSYFNITGELTSKDNFREKKYLILEDDIDL